MNLPMKGRLVDRSVSLWLACFYKLFVGASFHRKYLLI